MLLILDGAAVHRLFGKIPSRQPKLAAFAFAGGATGVPARPSQARLGTVPADTTQSMANSLAASRLMSNWLH